MRKDWILVGPCAQSLENFHSEVKNMKQAFQVLSQDKQHPPQINVNSSPLRNKGTLASQHKPSPFHLSHIRLDNVVSTQTHPRQLPWEWASPEGLVWFVPVLKDLVQLVTFLGPRLYVMGNREKSQSFQISCAFHEAELISASLVSKLRTNKTREIAELF